MCGVQIYMRDAMGCRIFSSNFRFQGFWVLLLLFPLFRYYDGFGVVIFWQ